MSIVHTEITLRNALDAGNARAGNVDEDAVRKTTVQAVVDTGAWTLVINENIREKLGLEILRTESGTLADGTKSGYNLAGPLEVIWKDRSTICEAIVLPTAREILLGAIPLEAMDLTVNPRLEEVVGAHGDQIMHLICTYYGY